MQKLFSLNMHSQIILGDKFINDVINHSIHITRHFLFWRGGKYVKNRRHFKGGFKGG